MKPDELAKEVRNIVHEVCGTVEDLGTHPHDVTSDEARDIASSIAGVLRPLIDAPSAEGDGSGESSEAEAASAAQVGEPAQAEQAKASKAHAHAKPRARSAH